MSERLVEIATVCRRCGVERPARTRFVQHAFGIEKCSACAEEIEAEINRRGASSPVHHPQPEQRVIPFNNLPAKDRRQHNLISGND